MSTDQPSRVQEWERQAEALLLLMALAFLVGYTIQVLDTHLQPSLQTAVAVLSWTVWAAFALDFAIRVALADGRRRYVLTHWYDLVLIGLPVLRPLRLLAFSRMINRSAVGNLAGRILIYVGGTAVSSVFLSSLAVLQAERNASGANIKTFGDALWWSWCTATTVGYGDRYPITTTGRLVGVALMTVGIALVGALTAAIAAYILAAVQEEHARTAPLHMNLHWPTHLTASHGQEATPSEAANPEVTDPTPATEQE